ncbi:MAG: diaminopimelate epimerase [bacterium]
MKFTKMHGIGNDFVVINALNEQLDEANFQDMAIKLNDRRFGVGGDGIILIMPSRVAHYRMRMYNPDGSEAEMCGNGIRCFAKYLYDHKLTQQTDLTVETGAGILSLKLFPKGGKVGAVRVNMGEPRYQRQDIPMLGGQPDGNCINEPLKVNGTTFSITCVSMGNPHAVVIVDDVEKIDVPKYGPLIETNKLFPARTNVHFVQVISPTELKMRTWERGAGITFACGTGACATAVACYLNKKSKRDVLIHLLGGDLEIEWQGNNQILMTGPAEEVFTGELS